MTGQLTLRPMRPRQEARLWDVVRAAVMQRAQVQYDAAQRRAWAPASPADGWADRLHRRAQRFVTVLDEAIVGLTAVTFGGHLDCAHTRPR